MGTSRTRRGNRLGQRHAAKLGDILSSFYGFLSRKPQPSDEEVRAYFIKCRSAWTCYAVKHELDEKSVQEFTHQVSLVWHKRQEESTD